MNERIRELAEQAGIDTTDFENCPIELYGAEQQLNKFAELIVRECSSFLKDTLDDHFAAEQLEEHFGVDE
jgi:ABC-type thiamine transport system ATPase subunit